MLNAIIDLSHNNGNVDFQKVWNSGTRAVIHKATQGTGFTDPKYISNRDAAKAQGLLWGAYHFGILGDGKAEADHFLEVVRPQAGDLLVLDFEHAAPNSHYMLLGEADDFVEEVVKSTGTYPGLYSGDYVKDLPAAKTDYILSKCWLWLAAYVSIPVLPSEWPSWTLWQYTDGVHGIEPKGVPGVNGNCDRDQFFGNNESQLRSFWGVDASPEIVVTDPDIAL